MRNWCIGALLILLSGCSLTEPTNTEISKEFHPRWPTPVMLCPVAHNVEVVNDRLLVHISWDEYITLSQCHKDVLRYIKELKSVVCHYRPDTDTRCSKEQNE